MHYNKQYLIIKKLYVLREQNFLNNNLLNNMFKSKDIFE